MPVSQLPQAPYRQDRKTFPTPIVGDVLFSEIRDGNRLELPAYGTPHPNSKRWPDHKLVFIKPVDIERNEIFEFFYAAERENQDLYNFAFGYRNIIGNVGGREFRVIQRSYVTLRERFEPLDIPFGTAMPDIPEGKFDGVEYVFFDRQQQRIEQPELDSLFVTEVHTYVERSFLDRKLTYTSQKPNSLPDKFRVSSVEKTSEQIVEGTATPPTLTGMTIEARESQLNPDVKLVSSTTRSFETPTSFSQVVTTNSKQLATVTETLQSTETEEQPSALVDIESRSLGDGNYVVTKTEVPDLFTENVFSVEKPDVVPEKFRSSIPIVQVEINSEGQATTPTLGSLDLIKSEQQLNKFVKRTRTTSRDTPSNGVTLNNVDFDNQTGRGSRANETLYKRGSQVGLYGTIENLFDDPSSSFWGQQSDLSFNVGEQLSDDWFVVKKQFSAPAQAVNQSSNPARKRFIQRVTPLGVDLLFYEIGSMPDVAPQYGSAHYDTVNWPNHKLIYIIPEGDSGALYRFYYAANREDQDLYNFTDEEGRALTRSYLIPREDYLDRQLYNLSLPDVGVSPDPKFGISDPLYGNFVFAGENLQKAPEPLDNLYVIVERVYLLKNTVSYEFNNAIERSVKITKTILKRGSTPTVNNSVGITVDIENVNVWYDIQTVTELVGLDSLIVEGKLTPIRLPDIPRDVNYNFPNKLNSVDVKFVSAYSYEFNDGEAEESYDDAFFFDYDLQSPPSGPYSARLIRYITDDPQEIRNMYPMSQLHPKRETVGIASSSVIAGNARAIAQQIELPESIHGPIDITVNEVGGDSTRGSITISDDLPISTDFFMLMAGGEFVAGYEVNKTVLNLYEVNVILIDITDLYSGTFKTSVSGQRRRQHTIDMGGFYMVVTVETQGSFTRVYLNIPNVILDVDTAGEQTQITYPTVKRFIGSIEQDDYSILINATRRNMASFFATRLNQDKKLSSNFIFQTEGNNVIATCVKATDIPFSMRATGLVSENDTTTVSSTSTLITI